MSFPKNKQTYGCILWRKSLLKSSYDSDNDSHAKIPLSNLSQYDL